MLISVVMEKKWEFHKIGIDMSSAFDTINRQTILNLLADAGCTEDEIRLVRFLLSNTKLRVRVNNTLSAEFISTEGAFQGDSLSGTLFTLTLAGALNHVRAMVAFRPNPPIAPNESEYSDDVDYIDEDYQRLVEMLPTVKRVLSDWCLFMNDDKTEHVHVYLAQRGDVNSNGKSVIDNEQWRSSKLLGSLLCSVKDIEHRIILANIAFNNFSSVWSKGRKISLQRLLRVYDAQVVSVLLYNCSSWAVPQHILEKLDITHRKHLRSILKIKWSDKLSNAKLYALTDTTPLSTRVAKSRWKLFGHILRSEENTPASTALVFADN